MAEQFPGWGRKMEAFQNAVYWSMFSKVTTVFRDSNEGGRVREANDIWCELHLNEINSVGIDESRDFENGQTIGDTPRSQVQCGVRVVNMEVRTFSRSQDNDRAAWNALEQARLRFRSSYVKDTFLRPANLGIATIETLFNLPKVWQDRIEDQATSDFIMNTSVTDQDAANDGTFIDRVLVSSALQNAGGVLLDPSIQLDDEVMGLPIPPP